MTVLELLPWVTGAGGALVALLLGCVVFYRLYREERARNTALVDKFAEVTRGGNDSVRELAGAVADAVDLVTTSSPARTLRRRARDA